VEALCSTLFLFHSEHPDEGLIFAMHDQATLDFAKLGIAALLGAAATIFVSKRSPDRRNGRPRVVRA